MLRPVTKPCGGCGRTADRDPNRIGNWHKACATKAKQRQMRQLEIAGRRRTFET